MNAGTLQRARKTPQTMMRETVIGEISGFTSLMGVSAPPSHAPAANPQKIPRPCKLRRRVVGIALCEAVIARAEDEFNEVCPGGRGQRPTQRPESRNGCR